MTKQEIFNQLKDQGCVSVYQTGSTANPYIKSPRDTEFIAVFDTQEHMRKAPIIYNVHKYYVEGKPIRYFVWGYLFHFINETTDYVGQKYEFAEPTIEELLVYANGILNSKVYDKTKPYKWQYHVAMVKAIEKYGYDNIPESVVNQINDIHDEKMPLCEFTLGGD